MRNYNKKRNNILVKSFSILFLLCISCNGFSQNWNEIMKTVNSDRAIADNYGWAVDISGNYAVIGAYGDDEDENGANLMYSSGSVYVLERNGAGVWS
ncbi:MAG: FG-GAP repeat protein, partial [Crocinitomicaceae bacterium]|nr:FG-GAP repeat protein [Crocinitomicaceae bacterium]